MDMTSNLVLINYEAWCGPDGKQGRLLSGRKPLFLFFFPAGPSCPRCELSVIAKQDRNANTVFADRMREVNRDLATFDEDLRKADQMMLTQPLVNPKPSHIVGHGK